MHADLAVAVLLDVLDIVCGTSMDCCHGVGIVSRGEDV
jgi:hypothetical protein